MADPGRAAVLVIGVGNELRGDDGAGIAAARRLRRLAPPAWIDVEEEQNDTTGLLERWKGRDAVVLIDAVGPGSHPGKVTRLDASHEPLPVRLRVSSSTHAVGLEEAIELARELGGLPGHVILCTVEGCRFTAGEGLSEQVAAALPQLAGAALAAAEELAQSIGPPTGAQ